MEEFYFYYQNGEYGFSVEANNPIHAFDVAYEAYGPQTESMIMRNEKVERIKKITF